MIDFETQIYEVSKLTWLYPEMVARKGKPAIFKGERDEPTFLFIGEAPGKDEDRTGVPFVGKAGQILQKWTDNFDALGIKWAVINAVPIMPVDEKGGIRKPNKKELSLFRPYLYKAIADINPKYLVMMGRSAESAIEEVGFKNGEWQNCIGFIYHPSYYLRNGRTGEDDFHKLVSRKIAKEDIK